MEKRKLVLTIIGVVILAMVIMVYIYFSKPGKDEKKNQQTINQYYLYHSERIIFSFPYRGHPFMIQYVM